MFVIFELIGNDVCGDDHDFSSMTSPEEFRKNILENWDFLEKTLPKGSHVVTLGVIDGRILFESLKNETHPIGVTYP